MSQVQQYETLKISRDGPTAVVTLNRPDALNAANRTLHREISLIWSDLSGDPDIRSIVLTGAGRAFSAGGDLGLLQAMVEDPSLRQEVMDESREMVRSFLAIPVPIVAAVNGAAVGLGCSLASLCDLVVMDEKAFFADPHVALGLVAADGGIFSWPEVIGLHQVKELLLLGGRVSATDALRLGLANRIAPSGTCFEVALELAKKLASLPAQAVQETKFVLNAPLRKRIEAESDAAIDAESRSFDTDTFRDNLAAALAR